MSTVLFLHGQPGGARDWERVVEHIEDDALAVDRPGWNGSGSAVGVAANAQAALATLDRAGAARATVVGHSFGGAVATWLAVMAPDRVSGLVLAAPSANLASLMWIDRVLAAPVTGYLAGAGALGTTGLALAARRVRRWIGGVVGLEERYLARAGASLMSPAAWRSFYVEQRALLAELPALEAQLAEISVPTTILAGSADRIVPVSAARQLAFQIPGARLSVIPGAGHLLPQREPARVAAAIASLARAPAPAGRVP